MSTYMPPIMTPFATIRCPSCSGAAKFSFATYQIFKKNDDEYFRKSREPKELKNTGSIRCSCCLIQRKHSLNWPSDAYFQITYKGKVLWAFDRKYTLKLLSYIESKERKKRIVGYSGQPWNTVYSQDWFLRHIPEHFQSAKARPEIVKKLKSILEM